MVSKPEMSEYKSLASEVKIEEESPLTFEESSQNMAENGAEVKPSEIIKE